MNNSRLIVLGGACGIVGTLSFFAASIIPMHDTLTYALAMSWPLLCVIFFFSLAQYINLERQGPANQLAFVFSSLAFALVAAMISIQLAVKIGIEEFIASTPQSEELLKLIRRSARLVDLGLDVAWDIFFGTALIFLSAALFKHSRFGTWWAVPTGLFGLVLIVLNVSTFPWPPDTRGLFDIGPVIALFFVALSVRLILLGMKMRRPEAEKGSSQEEMMADKVG